MNPGPEALVVQLSSLEELNPLFRVEKTIGRGTYARVKQVVNLRTGEREALKIMPREKRGLTSEDLRNESEVPPCHNRAHHDAAARAAHTSAERTLRPALCTLLEWRACMHAAGLAACERGAP